MTVGTGINVVKDLLHVVAPITVWEKPYLQILRLPR
jgi:hypothetical protein